MINKKLKYQANILKTAYQSKIYKNIFKSSERLLWNIRDVWINVRNLSIVKFIILIFLRNIHRKYASQK